jgi:four helix bundle protein
VRERPVIKTLAQHDRDLAIEMRRATFSVPQNIAEGKERAGRDRLDRDRVAAGSAARCDERAGV